MSEIERKYLLNSSSIINILKADGMQMQEDNISQFYVEIKHNQETRFRKFANSYKKTIKIGKGLVREELEEDITKDEYEAALKFKIGNIIEKKRTCFRLRNSPCAIDEYKGELLGLIVFEIEFESAELANLFIAPLIFQNFITEDVTEDESFKNKFLALFGKPKSLTNQPFEDFLQKCDTNGHIIENDKSYLKLHTAYDGMRAIFYSLFQKIEQTKSNFIKNDSTHDLHQFRTSIRKSRSLLQCVKDVFDEHISKRFAENLKLIASSTNLKRDLDVFLEYLEDSDYEQAEILKQIVQNKQQNETKSIKNFLLSDKIEQILQEWSVVLREDNGFFEAKYSKCHFKIIAAYSLIKMIKRLSKKIKNLDENSPNENFHSTRIEFKKLRYLLEFFSDFFIDKRLEEMIITAKVMQDYFGILQDRDVQKEILITLANQDEIMQNIEKIHATEVLLECVKNDIYYYRDKILNKKEKLIKSLSKSLKSLKPYAQFIKD